MKLRQKIALGLCTFYLISVIGVALSLHFCGETLAAVNLNEVTQCKKCLSEKAKPDTDTCCKNTTVDAKIVDSHKSSAGVDLPKNFSLPLFLSPVVSNLFAQVFSQVLPKLENKAPPFSSRMALYAFNCVFRN